MKPATVIDKDHNRPLNAHNRAQGHLSIGAMEAVATRGKAKGIDIDTLVSLADSGKTAVEIAAIAGCSHQNVYDRLARIDYNGLKTFRERKADTYERLQWEIAKTLEPDDIKRMQARDRITGIAILEDKIRLIRGQATEISVNFDAVKAIDARRKEIEARIRAIESGNDDRPQDVVLEADISAPIMLEGATNTVQHSDMTGTNGDNAKFTYDTLSDVGPRQGKRRGRPRKGR